MFKKKAKVGVALGAGIAAGYIASLFVSNKTKQKHKKAVEEFTDKITGKILSEETKKELSVAIKKSGAELEKEVAAIKDELSKNVLALGETLGQIDKEKYSKALKKTLDQLSKKNKLDKKQVKNLRDYFEKDFDYFKKARSEETK